MTEPVALVTLTWFAVPVRFVTPVFDIAPVVLLYEIPVPAESEPRVMYAPAGCLLLNVFQSVPLKYPSTPDEATPSFVLIVVCVSSPVFVPLKERFGTFPKPTIAEVIPDTVPVNVGLFNLAYVEEASVDVKYPAEA